MIDVLLIPVCVFVGLGIAHALSYANGREWR